jgi:lipopolysaccharide/colanic/teichoic acid biosynthesis glycosyltransferase
MNSIIHGNNLQFFDVLLGLSPNPEALSHDTANFVSALDPPPFLKLLRLEKRRAQRSKSALSLLLLTQVITQEKTEGTFELLNVVQTLMRETDTLGYINQETLAVLLPYTDDEGAKILGNKIVDSFHSPKVTVIAATYPDDIFESLLKGKVSSEALGLIVEHSICHSRVKLRVKRGIDLIGALMAVSILSPLMLAIAILVKFSSPGPIIFRQARIGHQGLTFTFYKFRSMRTGACDNIHREFVKKHISGEDVSTNNGDAENPLYKIKLDPRVTPLGRFIRKTSIDELPQLFNVLKGNMSLVGPRPPLPYETENYQAWQLRRVLDMKPGITGLWQVEGRGRTLFDEAVRLDICYIQNWSIILDLKILWQTINVVLRCKGAV